jgi:hypothetical protein
VAKADNCLPFAEKMQRNAGVRGDRCCVTKLLRVSWNEASLLRKKNRVGKERGHRETGAGDGLRVGFILSKHAEKMRTNLKKLGCLFEAFIGAIFLDFNKVPINDDGKWFQCKFLLGPGFQARLF